MVIGYVSSHLGVKLLAGKIAPKRNANMDGDRYRGVDDTLDCECHLYCNNVQASSRLC